MGSVGGPNHRLGPGNLGDLAACAAAGAEAVHIALPTSEVQMACIRCDREGILRKLDDCLAAAVEAFEFVSVGAQDATRADPGFLSAFIKHAVDRGAHRIRLSDTVGVANPMSVYDMISACTRRFPMMAWEFHAHNDFGMAAANSLTALQAGAERVDVTVLGLGERAGNAPLESVVMGARHSVGLDLGVDARGLKDLCDIVSRASGRPISAAHPVVGEDVLCHESGIHTQGQLAHPLGFQPFAPGDVGRKATAFRFGKHSGRAAVKWLLSYHRESASEERVARLTSRIKSESRSRKKSFTAEEVLEMAR